MEAADRFPRSLGVLQGIKGWRGHTLGERGHRGPERAPEKAGALAAGAPVAFLVTLHPWENPSFGLRPFCHALLPLPFQRCARLHFPRKELFPISTNGHWPQFNASRSSEQGFGEEGNVIIASSSILVQNICECIMAERKPSIVPGDS